MKIKEKQLEHLPTITRNAILRHSRKISPEQYVFIKCTDTTIVYTHSCGNIIERKFTNFYNRQECNSQTCINNRYATSFKKKHGVSNPSKLERVKNKKKETLRKHYGVDAPAQAPSIKSKMRKTLENNYGVVNPMKSAEIRERAGDTMESKYGVRNVSQHPAIKEKKIQTCLSNFGVANQMYSDEIKEKIKKTKFSKHASFLKKFLSKNNYELLEDYNGIYDDKSTSKVHKQYKIKHITCGNVFYDDIFRIPRCPICFKKVGVSIREKYWADYIEYFGFKVIRNDRTVLNGQEIDIYLPDLKIGFEYNGTYWHSEKFKTPEYHENKTKLASEKGVTLIHLWEKMTDEEIENIINQEIY